eukprot:scaffold856_cov326-Pavlova_lutheri.AAC.11
MQSIVDPWATLLGELDLPAHDLRSFWFLPTPAPSARFHPDGSRRTNVPCDVRSRCSGSESERARTRKPKPRFLPLRRGQRWNRRGSPPGRRAQIGVSVHPSGVSLWIALHVACVIRPMHPFHHLLPTSQVELVRDHLPPRSEPPWASKPTDGPF